ncbi:MAG: DUF1015 family protein [Acidobacteriota bacterium]
MALVFPFAALRPAPEAVARVAAVPYDVVSTDEARALADGNPLSFLHVSRPEIDLPATADIHGDEAYAQAAKAFAALRSAAPLQVEERPSIYVYRLRMGRHEQTGVAACFSIDEYDRDLIRKHEKTRPDKEDDRTRHMLAIRAQTGPVLLTYEASAAVDAAVAHAANEAPLYDFTAPDGVGHTVWRAPDADARAMVAAFADVPCLYIADGHHRAASAARARRALAAAAGPGEHDRMLAVAFPDNQMQILPYNRVVADLGGLTPTGLLTALRAKLLVEEGGPPAPEQPGRVAMYLDGRWFTLTLPDAPPGADAAAALDVSRLQDLVIGPLLGVGDVRTDTRIDFVGGIRGTAALEARVHAGRAAVAFSLYPVSVRDLMRIADAGGIMPPKSTWFEPKLRDGLLSHLI